MTSLRERILTVYRGEVPDTVPFMLDLSHWYYHKMQEPWDLSQGYLEPDYGLLDYHKKHHIGFYLANNAPFWSETYGPNVTQEVKKEIVYGVPEISWIITTPIGAIERRRRWSEETYSWHITKWGVENSNDLQVFQFALSNRKFRPHWDRYQKWADEAGDLSVLYIMTGYSAIGALLNLWMGIENTILATVEWPELMRETIQQVNANQLEMIDLLAESPAEVICMGDNFSSDIQSPRFFAQWSKDYYTEAVRRLHKAGKYVAVHIDGRLRGAIKMIRETGADCGDAITPTPMGDLTPHECREEAGYDFILSGGVAPNLWLPQTSENEFIQAVLSWIDTRKESPRLLAAAGDQVPPGAVENRMTIMRDLVEEKGKY